MDRLPDAVTDRLPDVEVTARHWRSVLAGAAFTAALALVPLLKWIAPLLGGFVAGYVQRDQFRTGAVVGVLAGVLGVLVVSVAGTGASVLFGAVLSGGVVSAIVGSVTRLVGGAAAGLGMVALAVVEGPVAGAGGGALADGVDRLRQSIG